jgi:hypothetical protein
LLTVLYLSVGTLLLLAAPMSAARPSGLAAPFLIFLVWSFTSLLWTTARFNGLQNVMAAATFVVLLIVAHIAAGLDPPSVYLIDSLRHFATCIAASAYLICLLWFGTESDQFIGPRSFSLFVLYGIAHHLARWRYGSRTGLLWAITLTVLIGVSQSRLALGIALGLFPLAHFPIRRIQTAFKMTVIVASVLLSAYASFLYFESLRLRFLTGDLSLEIGGFAINGSGRTAFWRATVASFWQSPLIGNGAGSAESLIASTFGQIRHPHGDYLRLAHDYGLIGLSAWLIGLALLFRALIRRWRAADQELPMHARRQLAALLSLVAFALAMTMENAFVYTFTTAPLGLIVGCALGAFPRRVPLETALRQCNSRC